MRAHRTRKTSATRGGARAALAMVASGAAIAVLLSGCAGSSAAPVSVALSEAPGYPADAPVPDPLIDGRDLTPFGWLSDDRATITIITYGSSSCPFIGTTIDVIDAGLVRIEFSQARAEACTEDLGSRTHVFATPAELGLNDVSDDDLDARGLDAELAIASTAFGDAEPVVTTVTLWPQPGVPPTAPSIALETLRGVPDDVTLPDGSLDSGDPLAFWGAGRETLRVITWGSSSCPPPALSVEVVSATQFAVVFGALPQQACTADFAPTTHVLAVPAGIDPAPVTLSITLGQGGPITQLFSVPIAD